MADEVIVCLDCYARIAGFEFRASDGLGFRRFECPRCGKTFDYPMSTGGRIATWVMVIPFWLWVFKSAIALRTQPAQAWNAIASSLLLSAALVGDWRLRRRLAAALTIAEMRNDPVIAAEPDSQCPPFYRRPLVIAAVLAAILPGVIYKGLETYFARQLAAARQEADRAEQAEDFAAAEKALNRVLELKPGDGPTLGRRAWARAMTRYPSGALQDAQAALTKGPCAICSAAQCAALCVKTPADALSYCAAAAKLPEKRLAAVAEERAGVVLYGQGRPADALAALDRAVALRPDFSRALTERAALLALIGDVRQRQRRALARLCELELLHMTKRGRWATDWRALARIAPDGPGFSETVSRSFGGKVAMKARGGMLEISAAAQDPALFLDRTLGLDPTVPVVPAAAPAPNAGAAMTARGNAAAFELAGWTWEGGTLPQEEIRRVKR